MATPPTTISDALETPSPVRTDANTGPTTTVRHVISDYPRIILFAVGVFLFLRFFEHITQALLLVCLPGRETGDSSHRSSTQRGRRRGQWGRSLHKRDIQVNLLDIPRNSCSESALAVVVCECFDF